MTTILGVNAYHGDSSACLIQDGKLLSAAEEERFKRIKHWAGFPVESIQYCFDNASLSLSEIDHIAINTDPKANFLKKVCYTLKSRPDFKMVMDKIKTKNQRKSVEKELALAFSGSTFLGEVHYIEHHLAHLASTYFASPFENSVALSIDGFGDFSSTAWGACKGQTIDVEQRVFFPHSLGIFYQALTQFIGFPNYGDEYKVMGLAPYGKPNYLNKLSEMLLTKSDGTFELNLDFFLHHNEKVEYEWAGGYPVVGRLFNINALEDLLGLEMRGKNMPLDNRHYDLAHSIQAMYEEAFFNILEVAYAKYGMNQLALAGGCAMNSVANGKVYRRSPFKQLYIQSAAGDAGGAIGAAYVVANELGETKERFHMDHAYWGPSFDDNYHEQLIENKNEELKKNGCRIYRSENGDDLCMQIAKSISEGLVIGWFQGRMEWGPRALGNRSILCDPRREDMKQILNKKIKKRESFRPFAPSILREMVCDWFEEDDDIPFMMRVFQIKEEKRKDIPAVTHVDGSGRLQTVYKHTNPLYHKLISAFNHHTGVPILLNTSFNENEPVVCRPEEALACFLRTKMDVLVLGNWVVHRADIYA